MIAADCAIHLGSMLALLMGAGYCRKVPTEQTRTSNGHAMTGSFKANLTLSTTSIFSSRSRTSENGHQLPIRAVAETASKQTGSSGRSAAESSSGLYAKQLAPQSLRLVRRRLLVVSPERLVDLPTVLLLHGETGIGLIAPRFPASRMEAGTDRRSSAQSPVTPEGSPIPKATVLDLQLSSRHSANLPTRSGEITMNSDVVSCSFLRTSHDIRRRGFCKESSRTHGRLV